MDIFNRKGEKVDGEGKSESMEYINETLSRVIIFPGSKAEFEEFVGYECEFIDVGRSRKGIAYDMGDRDHFYSYTDGFKRMLIELGIIGIVNVSYGRGDYSSKLYGIPARRKKRR